MLLIVEQLSGAPDRRFLLDDQQRPGAGFRPLRDWRHADPLLFWGHTPREAGPGPWCLSQWFPSPFTIGNTRYATAEHYMMWRKAELFGDARVAAAVLEDPDPRRAKACGREVAGFDGTRWEAHRFDAVVDGNVAKFSAHDDLRRYLLGTGDRMLVEASPHDAVWGIGLAADHPDAHHPDRWPGQNLVGLALMRTRELLR